MPRLNDTTRGLHAEWHCSNGCALTLSWTFFFCLECKFFVRHNNWVSDPKYKYRLFPSKMVLKFRVKVVPSKQDERDEAGGYADIGTISASYTRYTTKTKAQTVVLSIHISGQYIVLRYNILVSFPRKISFSISQLKGGRMSTSCGAAVHQLPDPG